MYGASQSLLTALLGIVKKKNRNVLVLLPYPGKMEGAFNAAGIQYRIISFPRCVELKGRLGSVSKRLKYAYKYYRKFFYVLPRIRTITQEFKPDVIYTNTSAVSIGYYVSKKLRIPHVWHVREFAGMDFLYYPMHIFVARCIAKSAYSIFYSIALKNSWLGAVAKNAVVVYNGIFDSRMGHSRPRSRPDRAFKIGLLGSILPVKGQEIAIQALPMVLQKVSHCTLLIYGDFVDKSYGDHLRTLVENLNIGDKVLFKEFVNDKDMLYANIDVLLNCTKSDGFGRTVVEGMIHGVPVIATNAGGINEVIESKVNGLTYNGTPDSLADSIIELVTDADLYHRLSINGIEKAKKYSISRYQEGVDNILLKAKKESAKRQWCGLTLNEERVYGKL